MDNVLTVQKTDVPTVRRLLYQFGLHLYVLAPRLRLPGSYWGAPEAGLIRSTIFCTCDTPIHSILHETGHYVCMPPWRRLGLHTDAGGNYAEENGVCYLQILLSEWLPGVGQGRMLQDMDTWGYTFRLGSARAWFKHDADDAYEWLTQYQLIDSTGSITWKIRDYE